MSANQNTRAIDNPVVDSGGVVWHRLHAEREDICEALLKDELQPGSETQSGTHKLSNRAASDATNWHRELLQARLQKIDDALDRLMSGSWGNCSKCGKWIEDTKLDFDPAIEFCLDCWERRQTPKRIRPSICSSQTHSQGTRQCDPLCSSSEIDSLRPGVELRTLTPLDTISVHTRNSDYRIVVLDPQTGRALVKGGSHFIEPVDAMIIGSVFRDSMTRNGEIALGLRMEMWVGDALLSTSPVQSFLIERFTPTDRASLYLR